MGERHELQTIIVGSGMAAQSIARQIEEKKIFGSIFGFIAHPPIQESTLMGIPILGSLENILTIEKAKEADQAIIALENADSGTIRTCWSRLKQAGIRDIRILPDAGRLRDAEAHLIQAREIGMEDLLGRDPVKICLKESLSYLRGKRVLITGAGGSIGRELCRQLLYGGAQRLYLFDHSENNVYEIDRELRLLQEEGVGEKAVIVPIIGELQDRDYMNFLLSRLNADVIFHTAAYKHVPLMEENPVEVFKNNVFGTRFLAESAAANGVNRLVLISTDKAVSPTSIYGVSKLLAEQVILNAAEKYNKDFMVVRFGNVLGSRGSIVPLFQKQIEKGGPITLTHPDIDRFFMTIPEAASLVLQAGGAGSRGNLYVLDMGEPIKIIDLARQMIRFYGFRPDQDIKIQTIGLRPGEKMHEELWESGQDITPTGTPKVNKLNDPVNSNINIEELLHRLFPVCFLDTSQPALYRNRRALKEITSVAFPAVKPAQKEPQY